MTRKLDPGPTVHQRNNEDEHQQFEVFRDLKTLSLLNIFNKLNNECNYGSELEASRWPTRNYRLKFWNNLQDYSKNKNVKITFINLLCLSSCYNSFS